MIVMQGSNDCIERTDKIQQRNFTLGYLSKFLCDYLFDEKDEDGGTSMNFSHYNWSPFLV